MLSVLTASHNQRQGLIELRETLAAQDLVDHEHIVVDGASSDGTRDYLEACHDARLSWVSEPDSGITEAMNKAAAMARGDWVVYLHCDDRPLSRGSLGALMEAATKTDCDVLAYPILHGKRLIKPRRLDTRMLWKIPCPHQAMMFRRDLFDRIGPMDTELSICADYEWLLRAWRAGVRSRCIGGPALVGMGDSGISSRLDRSTLGQRLREEQVARVRHSPSWMQPFLGPLFWLYARYRNVH